MTNLTHEQLVEQTARAQWAVISDDANRTIEGKEG